MFWNEPNLYGYTYREMPNIPTPFFGQNLPKYVPFGMVPWLTPQVPPVTPFYGMNFPQTLPQTFFPQINTPFYGMNAPQFPQIPQFPQFPQVNPLASIYGTQLPFLGLPHRLF